MRLKPFAIAGSAILLVLATTVATSLELRKARKPGTSSRTTERNDPAGAMQRGMDALAEGKFEQALRDLAPVRPGKGGSLQLFLLRGRAYYSLGQFDSAIDNLTRALQIDPQNQEARALRGDAYNRKNDLLRAMADYAELRTAHGEVLASRTERVRAEAAAQHALGAESAVRDLLHQANTLAQTGRSDEAIDLYTRILRMDLPLSAASTVCQNRGNAFRARGEEERAMRDYEQAIRFNPRNAGAYANRGLIFFVRGDTESALKDYDEALRTDPRMYEALLNRGIIYRNENELKKAGRDFAAAIILNPDFAPGYLNRGDILLREGKLDQALADFDRAEKLDSTLADSHYGRALVFERKRAYARSVAEFEKALQLGSASRVDILNALAWLRATCREESVRDGRRAIELAMEACAARYWNDPRLADTLAAAYAENGQFDHAVKFQRFALSLPNWREEDRAGAEKRHALYEQRRPYRAPDVD